jgi:hypothetical protein
MHLPCYVHTKFINCIPKKGDLSEISNYRPISHVNTDSKNFTRILNDRIMHVCGNIINDFQLGFIPGKFIAENGLTAQLLIEDAKDIPGDLSLGSLLDREKAYDRVELNYLKVVLTHYGFPNSVVNCIFLLFSKNRIKINVNGIMSSEEVSKSRGLKQGDPLSCILYNFAIEPLLRSILDDSNIQGYNVQQRYPTTVDRPLSPTKLICYADDLLVFLKNQAEFIRLQFFLDHYSKASNAKINMNKVEAISLSGRNIDQHWKELLQQNGINNIHTKEDTSPVIYLGFPLVQSVKQRDYFLEQLKNKLMAEVPIHSISVSVLGKATILNSPTYWLFFVLIFRIGLKLLKLVSLLSSQQVARIHQVQGLTPWQ